MKRFFAAISFVTLFCGAASSASACCLWPFGGWWGAGYGGYGGYYGAGYPSYAPVSAGYYSAGYGTTDCCAPACCDPCGGGCSSGSCAGSVAPSGSLKPQSDPNFDSGTKSRDRYDDEFDRDRLKQPADLPERDRSFTPRPRTAPADDDVAPIDDFRSRPGSNGLDTEPEPFGTGNDRINQKPPMAEPDDLPAVEPGDTGLGSPDGSTFLDEDNSDLNNQTRRGRRELSLTERTSGLNEVISPKRLASRSVPTSRVQNRTSYAGKLNSEQSSPARPVRWISLPMAEGNERL